MDWDRIRIFLEVARTGQIVIPIIRAECRRSVRTSWQAYAQPVENSPTDCNLRTLHDRALFRFREQKLPANGHSNVSNRQLGVTHQTWIVWRMAIGSSADG